jgi:phosphoenolpyruvate carboxykinase (GTP)
MKSMGKDTIFTNVALVKLDDGSYDVWWEDSDWPAPAKATDWQGKEWTPALGTKAAHPNSRFTAPSTNNPVLDPAWNDPDGVPVNAIIFGGRRSRTIPLVFQAFNWVHGVYIGATIGSETTAAATGQIGLVRRDPMAMLPFIGYNIRDYLVHWFRMRKKMADCPRIFMVNWFRKNDQGKFIWPGFGENMRVLKWIIDRSKGRAYAKETPLGWMPRTRDLDTEGLNLSDKDVALLEEVNVDEFKQEIMGQEELFLRLGGDLPKEMVFQRELLITRL